LSAPMLSWSTTELTKSSTERQLAHDESLPQIDLELSTTNTMSARAN